MAYARRGVRSCAELVAHLTQQGIAPAEAARAVACGRQQGWLDDRACGQLWAAHWARQGYAQAAIVTRLRAKGLAEAVIRQSLLKAAVPSDRDTARAWVQQGAARARSPRQLWGRLRRRGFDDDVIEDALRHASAANF